MSLDNAHEQVASNGGRSIGLVRHSLNSLVSSLAVEQHTNIGWNVAERLYSSLVAADACYDIGSDTLGQCQVLVTIPGSPVTTLGKYHTLEEDRLLRFLIFHWHELSTIKPARNTINVIGLAFFGSKLNIKAIVVDSNALLNNLNHAIFNSSILYHRIHIQVVRINCNLTWRYCHSCEFSSFSSILHTCWIL